MKWRNYPFHLRRQHHPWPQPGTFVEEAWVFLIAMAFSGIILGIAGAR